MRSMRASAADAAVSIVVPVHNGEPWLARAIGALLADAGVRPLEIIVVDDNSRDASRAVAARIAATDSRVRVIDGGGRGAAAAINLGVREARYGIVCQVDQDVEVLEGWLDALAGAMADPHIGAAQAVYVPTARRAAPRRA